MDCFAVCAPGLEGLLTAELDGLGIRRPRQVRGGIDFRATPRQLYAINVWSRVASRVVVRVAQFRATTFAELERRAGEIDWTPWLGSGARPAFRVTSRGSKLFHTDAIVERLARACGGQGDSDDGDGAQLFVVRVEHDAFTVSADSSGDHLHRRGWRLGIAKAPLRETLAAAMVLASEWDRAAPFVDPMCGSGTIAIEAALLAAGRAPGAGRAFALERWPSFQPGTWASVQADVRRADAEAATRSFGPIIAADRDAGAASITAENAARAGVGALVEVRSAPLAATLDALPSPAGWLVTNPPYGGRVGGADLRDLYATLGRAEGWHVGLLAADPALVRQTRLPLVERFRTTNGGIPVTFSAT
jgi:putative N6-adenine-specific DNA methylase